MSVSHVLAPINDISILGFMVDSDIKHMKDPLYPCKK
jgi:hypothetical protein